MIVGLGHQKQVGKDTAADLLVEHHEFVRFAFADRLKEIALDLDPIIVPMGALRLSYLVDVHGWDEAKELYPEIRKFLQNLGVSVRERIGQDTWLRIVMDQVATVYAKGGRAVVTDVRFPNEFQALHTAGATMMKIVRPGVQSDGHVSETALADAPWDYTVVNDGAFEDLLNDLEVYLGLGHPEL